jgi:hypothetical protein
MLTAREAGWRVALLSQQEVGMYQATGGINLYAHTWTSHSLSMSISLKFLRTKRRGDGGDMIIFAVIVVAALAFFGFITLNFHI